MPSALSTTFISAAFLVGLCGSALADDIELPEGYEQTGETRTCLPLAQIDHIDAITDDVFLIEVGSTYYINEVSGTCNGASRAGTYIEYKTGGSQLCSAQIIYVKDSSGDFVRGSCGLGEFELLRKIASEPAQ